MHLVLVAVVALLGVWGAAPASRQCCLAFQPRLLPTCAAQRRTRQRSDVPNVLQPLLHHHPVTLRHHSSSSRRCSSFLHRLAASSSSSAPAPSATHDKEEADATTSLDDLDDFVSDFIENYVDDEDDFDALALRDDDDNLEEQVEEEPSVLDFVQMVEDTPPGALEREEALLLREIMTSVALENNISSSDNGDDGDASSSHPAIVVERLLYRMLDEWEAVVKQQRRRQSSKADEDDDLATLLQPTTNDFRLALQAWEQHVVGTTPTTPTQKKQQQQRRSSNRQSAEAVANVWDLYRTMEDLMAVGVPSIEADQQVYESVMRALTSFAKNERGIDRKVRSVFDSWKRNNQQQQPTVEMYHCLISALAKSRDRGAANRAESFLREAVQLHPPGRDDNGKPTGMTVESFDVVLVAWAKSTVSYGPERAEKLIFLMDELDRAAAAGDDEEQAAGVIIRPSVSSFTSLLDAYAQKLDWDSLSQAERIFNRLLDEYLEQQQQQDGSSSLEEPNIATWTIVLSGWAKLSRKRGNKGAAPRADRLMRRMEELYEDGRISFGPDAIVYISVMNAWAFSKTVEGPEKAHAILNEMYELYMDGDDSMKPTAKSIRVVIEAWIRSDASYAMDRAEEILDTFEDHMDTMLEESDEESSLALEQISDVYKTMLFGWTKHGIPEQAQEYLMDMVENNMKVDSFCFDRVIEANTQLGDEEAMERTQAVFDLMEECGQKGMVKPNERVYTSFIRALAKAHVPNAAHKSYLLLKRMHEMSAAGDNKGIEPTVFTYNAVLHACSETVHSPDDDASKQQPLEAFKIAVKTFNELRTQAIPDHVSYGNMLRCAGLIPDGEQRDALIRSTFQLCCRNGYVNEFVLRDVLQVASADLWQAMLQCPPPSDDASSLLETLHRLVERLPASWKRKITAKQQEQEQKRKNDAAGDEVRRFRR